MSMDDLRMKLQSPYFAVFVAGCSDYISGFSQNPEARWKFFNPVSMTHPSLKLPGQAGKEHIGIQHIYSCLAEFSLIAAWDNDASQAF